MIAIARAGPADRSAAAVKVLVEVGTERSLPILLEAMGEASLRGVVEAGVARLADPQSLARLARAEKDPSTRRRWIAALLERDPVVALPPFMWFVSDDADRELREEALAVIRGMSHPPVEALTAMLDDRSMDRRFAAACVLGRVADRATLEGVIGLLDRPDRRREALLVLIHSSDPMAKRVVALASRDARLAGIVRNLQ